MKTLNKTILAIAVAMGSCASANAATIIEDFESLTIGSTATPTGWTYVNINGGSNAYITAVGNLGTGIGGQITGDNASNGNSPAGSYIVNSGSQAFDITSTITGSFDYYNTSTLNRATGGTFFFGDIQTGFTGTDAGQYLGINMSADSFGNRGGIVDGDGGSQLANFTGNQKFEQWYNVTFTWTPTIGTTGNFSATGSSSTTASSWIVSHTGFTFDSNEAHFGFGAGDYYNSFSVATYDNIDITGTAIPESSTFALLGLGGLALILRRRK